MSTAQTDENVEHTKRRIRNLVNEITELSKSDAKAADYYPAVLQKIIAALAAEGGAIWLIDPDGAMRLAHHVQLDPMLMQPDRVESKQHGRLLGRLVSQGRAELIPPQSGSGEPDGEANPTNHLLVTAPLIANKQAVGLLEILQRANSPAEAQRGYLRFLEHMTKLIGEWLQGHTLQQVSTRQEMWQQSDQFARLVHDNLDIRDTAYTIANEGRRLIECDRVSVAMLRGGKAKVIAISGQDSIENRSNIVQALNNLATKVIKSGEPLWYDGSTEDLPPQLEEAIEEYVDLSHGRTVTILPLRQPEKTTEGDVLAARNEASETRQRRDIIGALIVEQIETQLTKPVLEGRTDLVFEHACRAMSNSLAHSNILFMPVWRFLDRALWMFRGSTLPKTLAVLGLITAAIVAMAMVQIDFRLHGNGKLMPIVEKNVFAHSNGIVEEIYVRHGTAVDMGTPLVQMRDDDLAKEIVAMTDELTQALQKVANRQQTLLQETLSKSEEVRLLQEKAEAEVASEGIQRQLQLLQAKQAKLLLTSPVAGVVSTWDVEKQLNRRPVVMGQVLMTISARDGGWEVIVMMPEKRTLYLKQAFEEVGVVDQASGQRYLDVDFVAQSDSATSFQGRLYEGDVSNHIELDGENGPVLRLRCQLDQEAMNKISRNSGTVVSAKVRAGKASAAFVWFHEVVEWIRVNVLF